jgi:hypothetical protein
MTLTWFISLCLSTLPHEDWRECWCAQMLTLAVVCYIGHLCSQTKLDDAGCAPGCSTLDDGNSLVVARQDAVYFYSPDGRGPCFVLEGA